MLYNFHTKVRGENKILCVVSFLILSSCSAVDQFGERATQYNQQAADISSSSILTNILRSAYREPLQFTTLSGVVGTANASGSVSATLPAYPVAGHGLRLGGLNPSMTMSGGPQFSVSNANTQEFYRGIKSPITGQMIASYFASRYNPYVVLPLLVDDIEVVSGGFSRHISADGSDPTEFRALNDMIKRMLENGLTTEQTDKEAQIGPNYTADELKKYRVVNDYLRAKGDQGGSNVPGIKAVPDSNNSLFKLTSSSSGFRFCFKPVQRPYPLVNYTVSPVNPKPYSFNLAEAGPHAVDGMTVDVAAADMCGSKAASRAEGSLAMNMKVHTRSIEGVFIFLGNITRNQLTRGSNAYDIALFPDRPPFSIFRVSRGASAAHTISANFEGESYSLGARLDGYDGSSEVIQILSSLIALNSSAKDLPNTQVIAVGGQ